MAVFPTEGVFIGRNEDLLVSHRCRKFEIVYTKGDKLKFRTFCKDHSVINALHAKNLYRIEILYMGVK